MDEVKINLTQARPWFKKTWFIILVLFLILWFGLPKVLDLFIKENNINQAAVNQPIVTQVYTADDPARGLIDAPVVIVEFTDFQCPYSREAESIIKQLLQRYPEVVRFQVRDFPLSSLNPQAVAAAQAANCASAQGKYWQYHDALFANQDKLSPDLYTTLAQNLSLNLVTFNQCLNSPSVLYEINQDLKDGGNAGATGTPTWFVNGYKFEGVISLADWQKLITVAVKQKFDQTTK